MKKKHLFTIVLCLIQLVFGIMAYKTPKDILRLEVGYCSVWMILILMDWNYKPFKNWLDGKL